MHSFTVCSPECFFLSVHKHQIVILLQPLDATAETRRFYDGAQHN